MNRFTFEATTPLEICASVSPETRWWSSSSDSHRDKLQAATTVDIYFFLFCNLFAMSKVSVSQFGDTGISSTRSLSLKYPTSIASSEELSIKYISLKK
jgi:hypothetical protein